MGYIVCHARKVKTDVGVANVIAHNSRVGVYGSNGALLDQPEWLVHPERSNFNEGDLLPPKAILKRRNDKVKEAEEITISRGERWRKPQKNAASAIEFAISFTPGAITKASVMKAYFADVRAFLDKKYGLNTFHWATHFDEKTPHMHVLMVPIVRDENGLKYSSGAFLGGREGLRKLQDEISGSVGKKYGLERGTPDSEARHTDQHTYPSAVRKELQELSRKQAALDKALHDNGETLQQIVQEKKVLNEVYEAIDPKSQSTIHKMIAGVPSARLNECWSAFASKADQIREEENTKKINAQSHQKGHSR